MATEEQVINAYLTVFPCNYKDCPFNLLTKCIIKNDFYLACRCNYVMHIEEEKLFNKLLNWTIDDALLNINNSIPLYSALAKIMIEE